MPLKIGSIIDERYRVSSGHGGYRQEVYEPPLYHQKSALPSS